MRIKTIPEAKCVCVVFDGMVITCKSAQRLWEVLMNLENPVYLGRLLDLQARLYPEAKNDREQMEKLISDWLAHNKPTVTQRAEKERTKLAVKHINVDDLELSI